MPQLIRLIIVVGFQGRAVFLDLYCFWAALSTSGGKSNYIPTRKGFHLICLNWWDRLEEKCQRMLFRAVLGKLFSRRCFPTVFPYGTEFISIHWPKTWCLLDICMFKTWYLSVRETSSLIWISAKRDTDKCSSQTSNKKNAALIMCKVLTELLEIYLEIYKISFPSCLSWRPFFAPFCNKIVFVKNSE